MNDESHDDFMERVRAMSSATHRAVGFENPRAMTAGKMSAQGGLSARRSRRQDILALVALGKRDVEIADELGIAEDTVRTLRISAIRNLAWN